MLHLLFDSASKTFVPFYLPFPEFLYIFATREPAKPLNDAQMCGSFLFLWVYGNKNSVYKNIFHTPRISAATQNKRYGDNR